MSKDNKNSNNSKIKENSNGNEPLIVRIETYINERYELRTDEVMNVLEVKKVGSKNPFIKDEKFEANLTVQLYRDGFKGFSNQLRALLSSNFIKSYHPIKEYFESLPIWDKKDRLTEFINCVVCHPTEKEELFTQFKKHLLRCVASAYIPGFFNKQCFVMVGTTQSQGKTTFIRYLVPDILKKYFSENVLDWKDKDANIALGSNWIINLDELANLNKDESNTLKATLSIDKIKVRRPYERVESEISRLANFFGSTNDLQFLTDLTGNVRWICFRIFSIDWDYKKIDIDQIWAQIYFDFKNGEAYQMTKEEVSINEKRNGTFMLSSPELEIILKHLSPGAKNIPVPQFRGLPEFATPTDLIKIIRENHGYNINSPTKFGKALQVIIPDELYHRFRANCTTPFVL